VYAVELRVVVASVLAVAADTVLVAKKLLKFGAHLVTALGRLHVLNLTRRSSLEAESKRGGAEKRKKFRVAVWHRKQEMQVARVFRNRHPRPLEIVFSRFIQRTNVKKNSQLNWSSA
jgi:hypothetical protein